VSVTPASIGHRGFRRSAQDFSASAPTHAVLAHADPVRPGPTTDGAVPVIEHLRQGVEGLGVAGASRRGRGGDRAG